MVIFFNMTTIFAQQLILAPQDQDVISVSENLRSIDVLLDFGREIDSTHYMIKEVNNLNQEIVSEYSEVENPYTLDIPVYFGAHSTIIVTSYYKGEQVSTETRQVYFRKKIIEGYAFD